MGLEGLVKISVIVPVYNCAELISETMESLYNQQGDLSFEVIMVDDGSTDHSLQVCQAMAEKYENVIVLNQQNAGPSAARNTGLQHAKGEFVVFVDSDDIMEPDMLLILTSLMASDIELGIASYFVDYVDGREQMTDRVQVEKQTYKVGGNDFGSRCCEWYSKHILTPLWNKIYRRDIIVKNHLVFNEGVSISEDLLWNINYLRCVSQISTTDKCIYHYKIRKNRETVTHRFHEKHVEMQMHVAVEMIDFVEYVQYQGKEIYYLSLKYITSSLSNIFYNKELNKRAKRTFISKVMYSPTVEMLAENAKKMGMFSTMLIHVYKKKNILQAECILFSLYIFRRYFYVLQRKLMRLIRS